MKRIGISFSLFSPGRNRGALQPVGNQERLVLAHRKAGALFSQAIEEQHQYAARCR
jgi:hypothetical protein